MPIAVRVVSEQAFNEWVDAANKRPEWKTDRRGASRADRGRGREWISRPVAPRARSPRRDEGGGRTGRRKDLTMATPATTHGAHDHGAHDHAHDHDAHDHGAHANPTGWRRFVYSTNHKDIGTMYLAFALMGGLVGGIAVDRHPARADASRPAVLPRDAPVQRVHHRPRPDHDLLHGDAGDDRRLRQLVRAADDRGARHGVPAHEQHLVLAAAGLVRAAAHLDVRRRRAGRRPASAPAGPSTRRCRPPGIRGRRSISPSCRCISPAPRRSWARSTSSPPSSTCARPA